MEQKKELLKGKYLMYKGKPLVREKNAICYGSMDDRYVLFLIILTNKTVNDVQVPDRIIVQVISTDPTVPASQKVFKQGEKRGLYDALDIGLIWLARANMEE